MLNRYQAFFIFPTYFILYYIPKCQGITYTDSFSVSPNKIILFNRDSQSFNNLIHAVQYAYIRELCAILRQRL
jgi:hypothetical protein